MASLSYYDSVRRYLSKITIEAIGLGNQLQTALRIEGYLQVGALIYNVHDLL